MYIKHIILDGFKSYGQRTEIKNFDPHFNAITGLNGTGKSNVLDSICFLLGITNLSHVRAGSLQELIFKNGQAGVTKASVSIVFDNKDEARSPIGYEQHKEITVTREIVVAGKNRYMINGSTTTNKLVADFFNSVQLNVNNPHFLIMQGRITKVLNMKPPEILSMIEEAAGTRMYEKKKQEACKTIEKKDTKLKEIDEMVGTEINPKLERLKSMRSAYVEYQKVQRDLEHHTRIHVAYKYTSIEDKLSSTGKFIESSKIDIAAKKEKIELNMEKCEDIEKEVEELTAKIESESGGKLKALESELKEKESLEVQAVGELKGLQEQLNAQIKTLKQTEKTLGDDQTALNKKNTIMSGAQDEFDELRTNEQNASSALEAAQKRLQAINAGMVGGEGESTTFQEQLMAAKQQFDEANTLVKKYEIEIQHHKNDLKVKKPQLKQTESAVSRDSSKLESLEREAQASIANLKKFKYEDGKLEELQNELREVQTQTRRRSDAVDRFEQRFPQLAFHYQDPEPNFDRRKVKGLLCKLFVVKDEKYARALEAAAGAKLYNVVVENDTVSMQLIQKGNLAKRYSFAPMNRVQGSALPSKVLATAQNLVGKENALPAMSLIDYEPQYENILNWAFGRIIVCPDTQTASQVCYHKGVLTKTVTLQGDTYDPQGTLSGGAMAKSAPILASIREVREFEKDLQVFRARENQLIKEIKSIESVASSYNAAKQKLGLIEHEITIMKKSLESTAHFALKKEVEALEAALAEKEQLIKDCKEKIKTKGKEVAELEYKIKNIGAEKEKALKSCEAEITRLKKQAQVSREKWQKRQSDYDTLKLEIEELTKAVELASSQIVQYKANIEEFTSKIESLKENVASAKEEVAAKKKLVKAQKDEINAQNKEIQQKLALKDKLFKENSELNIKIIELENSIAKYSSTVEDLKTELKYLMKKYKWIETDKERFGEAGSKYDFKATNPKESEAQVSSLTKLKEKLEKTVNTKAMDMLGNEEEQFEEILHKKHIVEEDKSNIMYVIGVMDIRKEQVIKSAWEQVNGDFDSILSSLLPGAHAKLLPVNKNNFFDGLQIKCAFGDVWKESLDELSGGQRSLVALSLVLAMLLFKPAPLYILDEIDAALDASHTQNIGQMLKTHFKHSQFIIVSLKDGMFNNANVLFRTNFADGVSGIRRFELKDKKDQENRK